jgi:hypothetical protein
MSLLLRTESSTVATTRRWHVSEDVQHGARPQRSVEVAFSRSEDVTDFGFHLGVECRPTVMDLFVVVEIPTKNRIVEIPFQWENVCEV